MGKYSMTEYHRTQIRNFIHNVNRVDMPVSIYVYYDQLIDKFGDIQGVLHQMEEDREIELYLTQDGRVAVTLLKTPDHLSYMESWPYEPSHDNLVHYNSHATMKIRGPPYNNRNIPIVTLSYVYEGVNVTRGGFRILNYPDRSDILDRQFDITAHDAVLWKCRVTEYEANEAIPGYVIDVGFVADERTER